MHFLDFGLLLFSFLRLLLRNLFVFSHIFCNEFSFVLNELKLFFLTIYDDVSSSFFRLHSSILKSISLKSLRPPDFCTYHTQMVSYGLCIQMLHILHLNCCIIKYSMKMLNTCLIWMPWISKNVHSESSFVRCLISSWI